MEKKQALKAIDFAIQSSPNNAFCVIWSLIKNARYQSQIQLFAYSREKLGFSSLEIIACAIKSGDSDLSMRLIESALNSPKPIR